VHPEAHEWVSRVATDEPITVLDIGGRDVNGTCRSLFPNADYTVLDIRPAENVDIVADAATWTPDREYDLMLCTEVFEHTEVWPAICMTAYKAVRAGGQFIVTCAGPGRPPHSAVDGRFALHPGEYYANVDPDELRAVLAECGFEDITVEFRANPCDTRAVATKGEVGNGARRQLRDPSAAQDATDEHQ
jgi:hypothetical protein